MKKTIGLLSAIALSSTAYADVNVGGFVDAGYRWTKDANPSSSWGVNEGAVHFSGNSGSTSYLVDIGLDGGTNGAPIWDQGFVSNKYDSGFNWQIGKFDTILGHQGNDSNTWLFSTSNHISTVLGSSHTGALLGYDLSDMLKLNLLLANGTTTNDGFNDGFAYPEFGFRLDSTADGMSFFLGGTFEDDSGESGYVFNVGAKTEIGALALGLELALEKTAAANDDSGLILSVHGIQDISESMAFGARVEWDNGETSTAGEAGESEIHFDLGPQFMLSENATAYLDYSLTKFKSTTAHTIGLALRHNF